MDLRVEGQGIYSISQPLKGPCSYGKNWFMYIICRNFFSQPGVENIEKQEVA